MRFKALTLGCSVAAIAAFASFGAFANDPAKPAATAPAASPSAASSPAPAEPVTGTVTPLRPVAAPAEPITLPANALPAIALPTEPPIAVDRPKAADAASSPAPTLAPAAPPPVTAKIVSPMAQELQSRLSQITGGTAADRAALAKVYATRNHEPLFMAAQGFTPGGRALIDELQRAHDWGLKAADFEIPPIAPDATIASLAEADVKLALAALKYARHARGGRFDPSQLSNYIDRQPPLADPARVLDDLAVAKDPAETLRKLHPQHPQFAWLRQKYLDARAGKLPIETPSETPAKKGAAKPAPASNPTQRLLVNMEQWRWMPETLGDTYVWVNIPEFTLRVVKNGQVIHTERVITGKVDTQTPIFSDQMETIVFHPFWGVPDSIKVKEILPSLARGGGVLAKNNLRISYKGKDVDPQSIDWASTDIRNLHVYQPPGGDNVLGVVKFLFPNKHQVYMHDTPTKGLFNATQRTFSHGCMRVRDPLRLAEVLLGQDKGWDRARIATLAAAGAPQNNNVQLTHKFPVHVTYFTAFVDEKGATQFRPDIYGHEPRIQMGIDGKAHLIAKKKEELGPVRAEVVSRLIEARARPTTTSWIKQVFGF